jgi:putative membrane protein
MSDPRVFFAAERTLLGWIRSGLTIMGFGFVVARFGLFLRLVAAQHPGVGIQHSSPAPFSNLVGIALVLLGVGSMLVASVQYRSFVSALPGGDIPSSHRRHFPVAVALGLCVLGLLLAVYLAI